ncbi:hypothetical protein [Vibrio phage vB_pir03]|nr:hypothetical protein [Vibrio phage vB_pir03]
MSLINALPFPVMLTPNWIEKPSSLYMSWPVESLIKLIEEKHNRPSGIILPADTYYKILELRDVINKSDVAIYLVHPEKWNAEKRAMEVEFLCYRINGNHRGQQVREMNWRSLCGLNVYKEVDRLAAERTGLYLVEHDVAKVTAKKAAVRNKIVPERDILQKLPQKKLKPKRIMQWNMPSASQLRRVLSSPIYQREKINEDSQVVEKQNTREV